MLTPAVQRAIWASEAIPSCIRAPPLLETATRARRSATASSQAWANISPAADPSEPPRKPKSMMARMAGAPPMLARAIRKASSSPVFWRASATRAG